MSNYRICKLALASDPESAPYEPVNGARTFGPYDGTAPMLALTLSAIVIGFGTLLAGFTVAHVIAYRASR